MNAVRGPLEFTRSGRFRVVDPPIPEPIHLKITKPPGTPPLRVKFLPRPEPEPKEKPQTHQDAVVARHHEMVIARAMIHLGGVFWLHPDGTIRRKPPFFSLACFSRTPPLELLMDFTSWTSENSAAKMPATAGPIEKLESGFPCDPWRIHLVREGDGDDMLVFRDGQFQLLSFVLKH